MGKGDSTGQGSPLRLLHEWLLSPTQVDTGSTRLRVGQAANGSWLVAEPGRDAALFQVTTREQAVRVATWTLADARGGQIEVTDADGATHLLPIAAARRPWWQVSTRPLPGLLLGLLWLGMFVLRVATGDQPAGWSYDTFALVLTGVCAALYLTSTALLLRRRRARLTDGDALLDSSHTD